MTFDLQPTLIGEKVWLRPLKPEDNTGLFSAASDPLIWEQHPQKRRHEPDVFHKYFNDAIASKGALVILDAKSSDIIGSSRFHDYDPEASEIEIGWTFLTRPYWGGECNGEVKSLMLKHAFKYVRHVVFLVGPENYRSQKAVEKIGAVRIGKRVDGSGTTSIAYRIST